MRLPKERIFFVVDLLPVGQMPGRGMIDFDRFRQKNRSSI